jgi:hypothetical protein
MIVECWQTSDELVYFFVNIPVDINCMNTYMVYLLNALLNRNRRVFGVVTDVGLLKDKF